MSQGFEVSPPILLITTGMVLLNYCFYSTSLTAVILYFMIMSEQVLSPLPKILEVAILEYLSTFEGTFDKKFEQYVNKRVDLFGSSSKQVTTHQIKLRHQVNYKLGRLKN